ncbi:lantibiotic immunity ABC transporter MutE/EpiE family permease subunit [uncultured Clostridium sp.]|uniref:lantibiotic immunity ABC transporter MutE/EpiE family permease subunit n=1 Tax=uncultured Clostridium sp. TaxID=59620 RepID=UPI002621C98D|nr:lantibiotic immunity ABC transporter MutE/EpiE family permease subunit [uncultured Clostridium sp.]
MKGLIRSEWLKEKRSFQKKLILIAPIINILLAFALMAGKYFQNFTYNNWYILLLPASLTIISTAIVSKDKKRNFHGLFGVIENKEKLWISKVILGVIYLGIMNIILFLGCGLVGALYGQTISILNEFLASLVLFITFAWQIPLWMFIGSKMNSGLVLILSLICNFGCSIFVAIKWFWWIPFSIPARLMCATISVLPNGLSVEEGSKLLNRNVIGIGVLITIILFIIVTYVTAKLFKNQEV